MIEAIEDSFWTWRTVDALARETDLTSTKVEAILNQSAEVVKSDLPDKNNNDLYTTWQHYFEVRAGRPLMYITYLAIIFAVVSCLLPLLPITDRIKDWAEKSVLAVWVIGCPTWFCLEWRFLWERGRRLNDQWFNRFKYSQELASKVWLAVSALLSALYFGKKWIG